MNNNDISFYQTNKNNSLLCNGMFGKQFSSENTNSEMNCNGFFDYLLIMNAIIACGCLFIREQSLDRSSYYIQ